MLLDTRTLEVVALGATGLAMLSLLLATSLWTRLGRLERTRPGAAADAGPEGSGPDPGRRGDRDVEALRQEVGGLRAELAVTRADLSNALRHVAVVRYDAFGDLGGRQSFSAALLDDTGDGLIVTSINGRSETRTYAKGVQAGESDHALSPEEREAIGHAARSRQDPVAAGAAREVGTGPAAGPARRSRRS